MAICCPSFVRIELGVVAGQKVGDCERRNDGGNSQLCREDVGDVPSMPAKQVSDAIGGCCPIEATSWQMLVCNVCCTNKGELRDNG